LADWLEVLEAACRLAHGRLTEALRRSDAAERMGRGAGGDVSFRADIIAEQAVLEAIRASGKSCRLIMEEAGLVDLGGGPWVVVDALDGSRNAVKGLGHYATSLALANEPRLEDVELGFVLEHLTGRTYYAIRGEGAFEGARRLSARGSKSLQEAIIGLDLCSVSEPIYRRLEPVATGALAVRHLGSNAYELCLVARGALDAHVDIRRRIRPLDIAAGALIVMEAGGRVGDERGLPLTGDLNPSSRLNLIASAEEELFQELVALLSR